MVQHHKLSAAARVILETAATRDDHVTQPPNRLPVAAKRLVVQSLLKAGLIEEVQADDDQPAWRTAEDGARYVLRATIAGLEAVWMTPASVVPAEPSDTAQKVQPTPEAAGEGQRGSTPASDTQEPQNTPHLPHTRQTLRNAAEAVLAAWDDPACGGPALGRAIAALRAALSREPKVRSSGPRQPRPDTKRATILALLRRPEGATVAQVVDATGWARHTVHGFFAGLKKAGNAVAVLERVRQVGPGKQGAAGSYTVYHVAGQG